MSVNLAAASIAFCVVDALAVTLTFFRLGFRLKIQRFWWEDVWAAVASLCTVVFICSLFIVTKSVDPELVLLSGKIKAYIFASITWSVRMSLIFSIIRITPSALLRRILFITTACFILFWAATSGLQSWHCVHLTTISLGNTGPKCIFPTFIAIFDLITNTVSDAVTVILSFKLLWGVKLPPRQRKMILYLFSSSRYLCIFSLAHSISQLASPTSLAQQILAYLQVTVFMLVCNMVVVVTFIYRVFCNSRDDDSPSKLESSPYDDDFTTPLPRTQNLTTVDLEAGVTHLTSELGNDSTASRTNLGDSSDLLEES